MKKKLIAALLFMSAALSLLTACNPDPIDQERGPSTTTKVVGGFVIEENAPGYDMEWDDMAENPEGTIE